MTYIDEMIKELCPDGVELREIDKCVDTVNSPIKLKRKDYHKEGAIAVVDQGEDFIAGYIDTDKFLPQSEYVIFGDHSEHIKFIDFPFVQGADGLKILKTKDGIVPKYLYYCFCNFYHKEGSYKRHWSSAKTTLVPIPHEKIQKEIVKILDKFTEYVTELTAELTAELTLRQKQYNYFRDYLLNFDNDSSGGANNKVYTVQWKTLGEVCDVRDGTHDSPKKKNFGKYLITSKNIKCGSVIFENAYYISDEDFELINKRSKVDVDDLLFTMIGTVGEIAHIIDEPDFAIKNVGLIKTRDRILARYLFHYLQSSVAKKYIADNKSKGSQVFLALGKIRNFPIPYVPSDIQSRIVHVLDNFDTVCNDLNIGLPKEIELRQKQYEFFRDKLLTFTAEGVYTDSTVQYRQDLIRLLTWVFGSIRVKLGAVATVVRGKRVVKSQLHPSEGYPVYQNSLTTLGYFEHYNREAETAFLISAGAAGEVGYTRSRCWTADDVWTFDTEVIGQRYLYYLLMSKQETVKAQVRKASVPRLSKSSIENLVFILPPLDQQDRIVAILDRFDTLTTDLSQGLPAEIEQRQKQYEYWRDQLLQF
ncbi:restriction endonuclease subunit S [Streptococcus sp. 20-1249]|uniref:restriction endonuclease subunit S n=1 Tax=Streptococcus hepaticus TaxID=3349163 RepID=UPI0037479062